MPPRSHYGHAGASHYHRSDDVDIDALAYRAGVTTPLPTPEPVPSRPRRWPWIAGGAAVLAVALAVGGWLALRPSLADKAGEECQRIITARLKAPSTAEFTDMVVDDWKNGHFKVTGRVDAQNSFGAMIRNSYSCELYTPDEGVTWADNGVKIQ